MHHVSGNLTETSYISLIAIRKINGSKEDHFFITIHLLSDNAIHADFTVILFLKIGMENEDRTNEIK